MWVAPSPLPRRFGKHLHLSCPHVSKRTCRSKDTVSHFLPSLTKYSSLPFALHPTQQCSKSVKLQKDTPFGKPPLGLPRNLLRITPKTPRSSRSRCAPMSKDHICIRLACLPFLPGRDTQDHLPILPPFFFYGCRSNQNMPTPHFMPSTTQLSPIRHAIFFFADRRPASARLSSMFMFGGMTPHVRAPALMKM